MEELVYLGDVRNIPYLYGIVKAYSGEVSFKRTFKFVFEDAEFCVDDNKRNDNPIIRVQDMNGWWTYGILHGNKLYNLANLLSIQVKSSQEAMNGRSGTNLTRR
jgi:hypothetical protein